MTASTSTLRVGVLDCGTGNLFSLLRAIRQVGAEAQIIETADGVQHAERLIVPGVGAFADGMQRLQARGLLAPLLEAIDQGHPVLGICLGMQLLFHESEEFGSSEGLRVISGRVRRLQNGQTAPRTKIPHIGWSQLIPTPQGSVWPGTILDGIRPGESMYFAHSFAAIPDQEGVTVAEISYGQRRYCAVVEQGNVIGCQFHPEKSGEPGLLLLRNFIHRRTLREPTQDRE